jgi:hypothetical protein
VPYHDSPEEELKEEKKVRARVKKEHKLATNDKAFIPDVAVPEEIKAQTKAAKTTAKSAKTGAKSAKIKANDAKNEGVVAENIVKNTAKPAKTAKSTVKKTTSKK